MTLSYFNARGPSQAAKKSWYEVGEPATFTPGRRAQFTFRGQQYDLPAGQPYRMPFTSPCELYEFAVAANRATGLALRDDTPRAFQRLQAACARVLASAGSAPPPEPEPPPTPPPVVNPATTGTDQAPPPDGESSHSLSAPPEPAAADTVSPPTRDPGASDGRTLAEQYHDPQDPMPDYDVATQLSASGVQPDQIDEALESVVRNEPPPGAPHPQFGNDDHEPPATTADPVILFTGAFSLSVTDVTIPSRGFPLTLTRVYRSGTPYFGPWGFNWDHNYNVFLRPLTDGGAAVWTGGLSEDVYARSPAGGFDPPLGVFRTLEHWPPTPMQPERWTLVDRYGLRQVFEHPPDWPRGDRLPLVRLEDRHGNAHVFTYDAEGRLATVFDHAGRRLEFGYGDCGLVEELRDHAGRRWRYLHDAEVQHLETVVSPPTREHPDGLAAHYEYDRYQDHPALRHNLTRILDATGREVVENEYATELGSEDFGRVVRQRYGGYEMTYAASDIQFVPRVPDAINVPARRVETIERGSLQVYTFNYRGDLLDHRFRLVRDGSFRLVARVYQYDEVGNCIEERGPNGLGIIRDFDSVNLDPRARGNVLRVQLSAPPARPAPSREIARYSYEPRYQRIKVFRDERGAATRYIYDYEVSAVDHGDIVRIQHSDATLPDGSVQTGAETFSYNANGQIVERRSVEGHRFTYEYYTAGPAEGYLQRTTAGAGVEDQTQEFAYDPFGKVARVTTAGGATTSYERNVLGQLVRLRKPDVGGATGDVVYGYGPDGRLRTVDTPRGVYDDPVIADPFIRNEFVFDVLGHVRSAIYGANTAAPRRWRFDRTSTGQPVTIVDPLARVTYVEYDERMLPLRHTLFPRTAEERTAHFVYDRNGRLSGITDGSRRRMDYVYDSWDRLRATTLPGAVGARTRVRYTYGDNDELESAVTRGAARPGGPEVILEECSQTFDERGRLVRRAQGAVSEDRWHDRDGFLIRSVDQRGNATQFRCDALGRPVEITDPAGNRQLRTYDADGDLLVLEHADVGPDAAPAGTSTVTMDYDARGRVRVVTDPLGNATTAEHDDRDLLIAVTSPRGLRTEYDHDVDGLVTASRSRAGGLSSEHVWRRDAGGRVLEYSDPDGNSTTYEYDPEDRWTAIVTADGRRRERVYDASGRLVREISPSGSQSRFTYGPDGELERLAWTAAAGSLPVPDLVYARDGLGRPVRMTQGADTVDLTYDALGRLAGETRGGATVSFAIDDAAGRADLTYPDGRVDRYGFDSLGRVESIELRSLGTPPATSGGLSAGDSLARYTYVGPDRIAARVLGNGCVTSYRYDAGRRLEAIEHRDGGGTLLTRADYVHDADGARRFVANSPAPGRPALVKVDPLLRLTGMLEGFAAPAPPVGATQAAADAYVAALGTPAAAVEHDFTVDVADVRTRTQVRDGAALTTDDVATDAAYRITQLTRTAGAAPVVLPFDFDDDGRCVRDHRHRYVYDVMGRLREVHDLAGRTLLTQDYDPVGRVVASTAGGAAQTSRYLGARAVQLEDGTPASVRQRCFGANPDELVVESGGGDRWAHQDARLSLLALTDSGGAVLERYSYAPFGSARVWAPDGVTPRAASSAGVVPIFGGHRLTGVAGLYDARARAYDAETGRFLQRDPRGYVSGPNPYAYTRQNPVDGMDPSGEVAPIIAAIVIIGALAGAGYSFRDASEHPERYEGPFAWRAFFNTGAGALIGGASALGGEAVLASVGMGSFAGAGAAGTAAVAGTGTTLTLTQTFVLSGTVSAVGGLIWRTGFNGLFPEYEAPPSVGTMVSDYLSGGFLGVGFRALEAVGNPFSRAGWNTIRMSVAEARVRARIWWNQLAGRGARAEQIGREIAEIRVGRLHASELQEVNYNPESVAYRLPGQGQKVVFNPEIDAVLDSAWIQVKTSAVPGRAARFGQPQAEYTAFASPTGRSIYYVEPGRGFRNIVGDLLAQRVSEVRPLTPWLRGTEPFPLPFQGLLGLPMARVPWPELLPDHTPAGGFTEPPK